MRPIASTHPNRARTARALVTGVLLSLAASCGNDPTSPTVIDGTASLSASGAVSATGAGLALFQSTSSGAGSLFQVVVVPASVSGSSAWQLQIVNYSGRLAEGTYRLSALSASSNDPTANFYVTSGGSMTMYNSTDGELVITSSSTSGVRGTVTFTAANTNGGGTVTVQGSFAAKCAPGTTCS